MDATKSESNSMMEYIHLKDIFPDIPRSNYLTHGFDRYPAKMIPHMARFLIQKVSKNGETILDPFCGSGAVLVESIISGRNAIGVDLNPIAILLAKAKTIPFDPDILELQLEELLVQFESCTGNYEYNFPNSNFWFTTVALRKLGIIKLTLDAYSPNGNKEYLWFWRALASSIVRDCSNADLRGPKPFISKKARESRLGKHFDPFKIFESKARLWISLERQYIEILKNQENKFSVQVIEGDSRNLSEIISKEKVDSVITSPPYLSAQDYYRASKLQLFIFGHSSPADLIGWSRKLIGSDRILSDKALLSEELSSSLAEDIRYNLERHNKRNAIIFSKYVLDMSSILSQINLILKRDSYCALVTGYNLISGIIVPTPEIIVQLAENEGFCLKHSYRDKIRDRWVPPSRNGHNGVIQEEHLLLFRK